MNKKTPAIGFVAVLAAVLFLQPGLRAQSTAYWINTSGGEWNTAANWNVDFSGFNAVPGVGTNADVGSGGAATVDYSTPMAAPSFGALTLQGGSVLNVNATGFNMDGLSLGVPALTVSGTLNEGASGAIIATNGGPVTVNGGAALNIGGSFLAIPMAATAPLSVDVGGFLNVTPGGAALFQDGTGSALLGAIYVDGGSLQMSNCGTLTLSPGASITVSNGGVMTLTNSTGSSGVYFNANNSTVATAVTVGGGTLNADQPIVVRGRASVVLVGENGVLNSAGGVQINETSNDGAGRLEVDGGTANIGNFSVYRTASSGGLIVNSGVLNATGIQIGVGNASSYATINGGFVTNSGLFTISDTTNAATSKDRRSRMLVRGGTVVSTSPDGIILGNQANGGAASSSSIGGILDINSGMVMAGKITLVKDNTLTNAYGTLNLSGTGTLYLGSGGLIGNTGAGGSGYFINVSGGTIGATADWTESGKITLSGTTTFQAADPDGAAHNITIQGQLTGSGSIVKTGAGTLTLDATNNYSGSTTINGGALALTANGSISNTPQIVVADGATLDVSQRANFALVGSQVLSGSGSISGFLTAQSGTGIRPGGAGAAGTVTFMSGLDLSSAILTVDLSDDPTGTINPNDLVEVTGDLTLEGISSIVVNPLNGSLSGGSYALIHYTGNLTGDLSNLSVSGASGSLTNDTSAKMIALVVVPTRGPSSVTWVGNPTSNVWDSVATTNWLNAGNLDFFVTGDDALFDATGAANPMVDITEIVLPGSVTVDATADYTFMGAGRIAGATGLIKTNSGSLTLATTNSYSAPTIIGGGTIVATTLGNAGVPSSIGAPLTADPSGLQFFDGATLRYTGPDVATDRGATLNDGAAIIDVAASTVTASGTLAGPGSLVKAGAGTLTLSGSAAYEGVTTISNGVLRINGSTTAALATNALNLAGGTAYLNVSGQPNYQNAINVTGGGGINVAGNNTIFTGPWSGAGTVHVNVNSGGYFTFNADITTNFVGTLAFDNSAGTVRFNAGGNSSGPQQSSGSPMIHYDLGTNSAILVNRNGGGDAYGTYFLGALSGGPNTFVRGSANSGSSSTYQIGDLNLDTTFAGTIQNGFAGTSGPQNSAAVNILKVGSGALTLAGTNTYSGNTIITNGVLALSGDGDISASPIIAVVSNSVLDTSARVDGAITLASGQTLQGSGAVRGSVIVASGANLTVGDDSYSPKSMIITNSLTIQSGGALNMDLDHYQYYGGPTSDTIEGLASVTYGGTLNLNVLSVETNSVFKLFDAGSYGGSFESINPPVPPLYPEVWGWDTSYLTVDGTLRIAPLRPKLGTISISGTDLTITGVNGIPNADFYLLTSTNIALPISQWTPIATNNFGTGGNFNFTFTGAVDPAAPKQFYTLQVP